MHRELNTKDEMKKRLLYAAYLVLLFSSFLLVLRGLFSGNGGELFFGVLMGTGAYLLRTFGKRRLEFDRMYQSFPMGETAESLSWKSKKHFERLLHKFHQSRNWVVRQEIRKELEALVKQEPNFLIMYQEELKGVHPGIFYL